MSYLSSGLPTAGTKEPICNQAPPWLAQGTQGHRDMSSLAAKHYHFTTSHTTSSSCTCATSPGKGCVPPPSSLPLSFFLHSEAASVSPYSSPPHTFPELTSHVKPVTSLPLKSNTDFTRIHINIISFFLSWFFIVVMFSI